MFELLHWLRHNAHGLRTMIDNEQRIVEGKPQSWRATKKAADAGVGSYLNGSIGELVAYDNDVSAAAASRMRSKLMKKYGIAA